MNTSPSKDLKMSKQIHNPTKYSQNTTKIRYLMSKKKTLIPQLYMFPPM